MPTVTRMVPAPGPEKKLVAGPSHSPGFFVFFDTFDLFCPWAARTFHLPAAYGQYGVSIMADGVPVTWTDNFHFPSVVTLSAAGLESVVFVVSY